MSAPAKPYAEWLQMIIDEGNGLTAWETNFITDVADQMNRTGRVSEKQGAIIERIYVEKVR